MVKEQNLMPPKARIEYRPFWVNILEYLFTSPMDVFTTREVVREIQNTFPDTPDRSAMRAFYNVRLYLVRNGIASSRKVKTEKGGRGRPQCSITIINRDRIPAIIKKLPLFLSGHHKPKIVPAAAIPVMPSGNGLTTRSERVIAALYKRCLEYKKEVAELLDELAACRASVHDATRKVAYTNDAISRADKVASEIDLVSIGINPEEI